jgi:hypothetical protein
MSIRRLEGFLRDVGLGYALDQPPKRRTELVQGTLTQRWTWSRVMASATMKSMMAATSSFSRDRHPRPNVGVPPL